jgi:aspartyl-tRNA(Asn)/glutamyl-tRNA(Gln) amidotransferase subunit A
MDDDLHSRSVQELATLLFNRKLSSEELTKTFLARIETFDRRLNTYLTVSCERALLDARRADEEISRGYYRGALHGIPISLKDLFLTRGIRTTAGSKTLIDWYPRQDGTVVRKLHQNGAILLGKTGLHEWAYGGTSDNPHFGPIHNPWAINRIPGGSSGGSAAALAAGLCSVSLGTDTGGSVRLPAAFCGVVGLKPTFGLVSRRGVVPLSWSADHVGPMARTVRDCAVTLQIIAGYDCLDGSSAPVTIPNYTKNLKIGVEGLRIGVLTSPYYTPPDSDVAQAFQKALYVFRELGAEIQEIPFERAREAGRAHALLTAVEASHIHQRWLDTHRNDYSEEIADLLTLGFTYSRDEYVQAMQFSRTITRFLKEVLSNVDVLTLPTNGFGAPPIGQDRITIEGKSIDIKRAMLRYMSLFNYTGMPSISIPCGMTAEGLPIGLQIAGQHFDEVKILQVAYAYEQATSWHTNVPLNL